MGDKKDPKAVIKISDINVAFSPKKIHFPNSLQIDYLKDGSTRHIYVYHGDPQTVVNWYHAIRCCKLHLLQVGYPSEAESELLHHLSQDYVKEGYLSKTGPSPKDVYKRRWCTLEGRKLTSFFTHLREPTSFLLKLTLKEACGSKPWTK